MKEGGKIAATIREELLRRMEPGVATRELEELAVQMFNDFNVVPSFLGYQGYPFTIITCFNEEVVHGMPSDREIELGDVITLDLGVFHKGFHTDTAKTREIGTSDQAGFLQIGRDALSRAIKQAVPGNHIGDISHAIQDEIESHGYNVIRAFVGHEIGKNMHEDLQIPCFGSPGEGPELYAGMTLAVEVMYMQGTYKLNILDDGWTAVTKDGSLSAMFEHTIAITQGEPLILTA